MIVTVIACCDKLCLGLPLLLGMEMIIGINQKILFALKRLNSQKPIHKIEQIAQRQ